MRACWTETTRGGLHAHFVYKEELRVVQRAHCWPAALLMSCLLSPFLNL